MLEGLTIRIQFLGCRTNLAEAEALASAFLRLGARVEEKGPFDAGVLMTCAVTAEAARKTRQTLRRMVHDGAGAPVVAAGCWCEQAGLDNVPPGVACMVGNRRKSEIPDIVQNILEGRDQAFTVMEDNVCGSSRWDELLLDIPTMHTRAFIKVQDGCSRGCSYCIIPSLRGRPVARDADDVVREAQRVAAPGCREVVLTGIHLGWYGLDGRVSLGTLVGMIAATDGLDRIRMGSLEPFALDEELLASLASSPSFCRHLHLPLQSGDDAVLGAMRRGYGGGDFIRLTGAARKRLGDELHVSTDVIVGFPGETEEAFAKTMRVLEESGVGRVHLFPFSPREGTDAAKMNDRVPAAIIRERMTRAKETASRLLLKEMRRRKGGREEVLVERTGAGWFEGLTEGFLRFRGRGKARCNEILSVAVDSVEEDMLTGPVI
ncbi:MAG: MiaB/RimO family radical SAM methylthiotransferase [Synergistota bacterium]|nr:MiaB/RimO family radical SAM methylthiotransferase [Synergistota bacterium]